MRSYDPSNVFLVAYLFIYAVSILVVSLDNFDFTDHLYFCGSDNQ